MRTICLLITFTLFPSLSLAQVLIEEKYEYYQIAPKSKEEILTSLNHMSPVKNNGEVFHGYAYTAIKWDFLWKYNSISCWVTSVETKLTTTYTLPKLMSNVGVVNSIWREWFPNLVKHEKGHHGIARIARQSRPKIAILYVCQRPGMVGWFSLLGQT